MKDSKIVKAIQKLAKLGKDFSPLAKEVVELWKKRFKKSDDSNGKESAKESRGSASAQSLKSKNENGSKGEISSAMSKSSISYTETLYDQINESIRIKELSKDSFSGKRNHFRGLFFEALCWKEGKVQREDKDKLEEEFLQNIKTIAMSIEDSNFEFNIDVYHNYYHIIDNGVKYTNKVKSIYSNLINKNNELRTNVLNNSIQAEVLATMDTKVIIV
jgi:hypothetical protein